MSAKFRAAGWAGLLTGILWLTLATLPTAAAPPLQLTPFPTPTPGPDGRIVYTVQTGDTLWRIAAISGLSLEEIRLLNNLGPDDPIIPGQILLLGLGGPVAVSPTVGPTAEPTSLLPTPSPFPGSGMICVQLFEDENGDAFRQDEELAIGGGAVSITNRSGTVSLSGTTSAGEEPNCFEELPEGDYNITVAVPEGYNPTTLLNYPLDLAAGDETILNFGAQISTQAVLESPPPAEGGQTPILGVLGGLLLVAGLGLAVFAGRMRRNPV